MNIELEAKQTVMNLFEQRHPDFLNEARKLARWYCYSNQGFKRYGVPNAVTSDDVRDLMNVTTKARYDKDNNNAMGAVFRQGFERIGFVQSNADRGKGRIVGLWKVKQN